MKTIKTPKKTESDRYFELVREFPLKPIRTQQQQRLAQDAFNRLALFEGELPAPEQDYLDALVILLEAYDQRHPWELRSTGLDLLKELVQQRGMTVGDVGRVIGDPIAGLADSFRKTGDFQGCDAGCTGTHFHVSPGAFL